MPRPRKQPIKSGDEITRGGVAVPHSGVGQFVDVAPRTIHLASARPSWEYRVAHSGDGVWWEPPLNTLGALGWELVTIYPVGDATRAPVYYAVFKRQQQDANA